MKRLRLVCCLAALLLSAVTTAPVSAGTRTLTVVSVPGRGIGVQGTGWGQARVVVSLQTGPWLVAVSLRPNESGMFTVAAMGTNVCNGLLFRAYDQHGHSKTAHPTGPPLGCAASADPPRPRLHIVSGERVSSPTVRVIAAHPTSVALHLGQELYLWEPGVTSPALSPNLTDTPALVQLIARGQTAAKMCSQTTCAAGFYWKWIAVKTGDTGIVLSAACRQSKPPCMVPDFIVRIHIAP